MLRTLCPLQGQITADIFCVEGQRNFPNTGLSPTTGQIGASVSRRQKGEMVKGMGSGGRLGANSAPVNLSPV